ncbi:MAG: sigma-54-dependent Fis family transcriptional regulator [Proteobacteria bacterium]|nr:sigma-54-dependent Fis family transcriptional regulator [Pseudomonadota bacterium]
MSEYNIVVVDDEVDMRGFLEIMLTKEGYGVTTFASAVTALEYLKESRFDLVITDLRMPEMDGVELLKAIRKFNTDAPVIMVTAYASVDTAIEAMKSGAYDYFNKPFNVEEIKLNIAKALKYAELSKENRLLKKDFKSRYGFANLVGTGVKMTEIYSLIMSVANTKSTVFITGESGTGKELVARAIHFESNRKSRPFVAINCGAIPENLIESELFGHQKGAFTGAVSNKPGLVEEANGGTLFLDEITELPQNLQVKFLRFIQERNFRRVGGTADICVDIRIIAASNKEVEQEVSSGAFRKDLFYRLNVIRVEMPTLKERREDIALLATVFMEKYAAEHGKKVVGITGEAMGLIEQYGYPGNVRELENVLERAVTLEAGERITVESLPAHMRISVTSASKGVDADEVSLYDLDDGLDLEASLEEYEKRIITEALSRAGGVKKKAAESLGLSLRSMRYKIDKYDIRKN